MILPWVQALPEVLKCVCTHFFKMRVLESRTDLDLIQLTFTMGAMGAGGEERYPLTPFQEPSSYLSAFPSLHQSPQITKPSRCHIIFYQIKTMYILSISLRWTLFLLNAVFISYAPIAFVHFSCLITPDMFRIFHLKIASIFKVQCVCG